MSHSLSRHAYPSGSSVASGLMGTAHPHINFTNLWNNARPRPFVIMSAICSSVGIQRIDMMLSSQAEQPKDTMPWSYPKFELGRGELESFEAYAAAMPDNCVFLVDTWDTEEGVRNAIRTGEKLRERGHAFRLFADSSTSEYTVASESSSFKHELKNTAKKKKSFSHSPLSFVYLYKCLFIWSSFNNL